MYLFSFNTTKNILPVYPKLIHCLYVYQTFLTNILFQPFEPVIRSVEPLDIPLEEEIQQRPRYNLNQDFDMCSFFIDFIPTFYQVCILSKLLLLMRQFFLGINLLDCILIFIYDLTKYKLVINVVACLLHSIVVCPQQKYNRLLYDKYT